MTMNKKKGYDAFISYKHDRYVSKIAHTVLRRLEHYRPPKGSDAHKKRLYLCIDDQNFAAVGVLNRQIHETLANSEYLIYLACPETLESEYCLEELRYFKKLHKGRLDNIIVLLLKGEPKDVFPQELCYEGCWESDGAPDSGRKAEILWLDLRADNSREAKEKLDESLLKIAAPLLHCDPDGLIQRDRQWKKQKRMMWGMLAVTASAVALCVVYTFWLTWSMDYKRQAENALADGNDNKALFYYAKTLSLNPFDEEAQLNSQILLQKEAWPVIVRKEKKDSRIVGKRVYPVECSFNGEIVQMPVCATTKGNYVLWIDGDDHSYVSDSDGNILRELSDAGSFFGGQTVSDVWCFVNDQKHCYTFYWPEDQRMEKLMLEELSSGARLDINVIALQPGVIVVNDYEALTFHRLEDGNCVELCRFELNEIFHDEQFVQDGNNVSFLENSFFDLRSSPDGSCLVMTANYWYNSYKESFCHSVATLIDTENFALTELAESDECLISEVEFQDDSQKLALIYNNDEGVLENLGGATVYDCGGKLVFQTELASDIVPQNGYFCGEIFLLSGFSESCFLDAKTGEQLCEPLPLSVNQATLTDDGQIALEHLFEVEYCRIVRYSEDITEIALIEEDIANAFQRKMEMKYQLTDNLWLRTSDDRKSLLLTDQDERILDCFPIWEEKQKAGVIELSYGSSTQAAFALDEMRDLHCIPIDLEHKEFSSAEEESVHSGVLAFQAAKNGVIYLDGYVLGVWPSRRSTLWYYKNDDFLFYHDPVVNYYGWFAQTDFDDPLLGIITGESDYAVILTQKEEQKDFHFFSMKTGNYLADMSVGSIDDGVLLANDTLHIHSDGDWYGMWFGLRRPDSSVTKQLMNISGYKLSGSRLRNDQRLEYADAATTPDSFGSWTGYLKCE